MIALDKVEPFSILFEFGKARICVLLKAHHLLLEAGVATIARRKQKRTHHFYLICEESCFALAQHRNVGLWAIQDVLYRSKTTHSLSILGIEHDFLGHRVINGDHFAFILVNLLQGEVIEGRGAEGLQERWQKVSIRHKNESKALSFCWSIADHIWRDDRAIFQSHAVTIDQQLVMKLWNQTLDCLGFSRQEGPVAQRWYAYVTETLLFSILELDWIHRHCIIFKYQPLVLIE